MSSGNLMSVCLLLSLIGLPRKVDIVLSWLYVEQKILRLDSRMNRGRFEPFDSLWIPRAYICVVNSPSLLQAGGPNFHQMRESCTKGGDLLTRIPTHHVGKQKILVKHPDHDIVHWAD